MSLESDGRIQRDGCDSGAYLLADVALDRSIFCTHTLLQMEDDDDKQTCFMTLQRSSGPAEMFSA